MDTEIVWEQLRPCQANFEQAIPAPWAMGPRDAALEGLGLSSLANIAGTWTVRSIAYAVYGLVPEWAKLRHWSSQSWILDGSGVG